MARKKSGRKPLWQTYYDRGRKYRQRFTRRALAHKNNDYEELIKLTKNIRENVNRRIRALKKAGLDYSKPYNNFQHYLNVEWETDMFPTLTQINYDMEEIRTLNEHALKFLNSPLSTVKGVQESNAFRVERLQQYEVLPSYIVDKNTGEYREASYRKYRDYEDFLRFLGNEEVQTAIDDYGTSDQVVDMLYDYWMTEGEEGNNTGNIRLLKIALGQFNAGMVNFDKAMRKVGIKIEDYIST